MLSGMSIHPSTKSALALVIAGALLSAGGVLSLAIAEGDAVGSLLRQVLTFQVFVPPMVWFAAAWGVRRFAIGKLPTLQLSFAEVVWGGSRVALLIATALLLIGWLATLAFGLGVQLAFVRAVVLLAAVSALTGIAGGAYLNSMLAIRHWRVQSSE